MCIRDRLRETHEEIGVDPAHVEVFGRLDDMVTISNYLVTPVSYTHLRAHETVLDIVCRLLLDKKTD